VYLLTGPHGGKSPRFINQVFAAMGTIFIGFSMRWFMMWWSYNVLAFLNVPVALVLAVSGTSVGPSYTSGVKVWFIWVLFSACFVLSLAAVLMWIVAEKYLPDDAKVESLVLVTRINLVEQLIYDATLALAGALCMSPAYNKYGMVQACVFALLFGAAWLMHVQMLVFFAVTESDDPMHSQRQLRSLLLLMSGEVGVVVEAATDAVVEACGSPNAKKKTTPEPSKVGSPVLESAQSPGECLRGDLEQC